MAAKSKVEIVITGKSDGLRKAFGDAGSSSQTFGAKLTGLHSALAKVGVALGGLLAAREVGQYLKGAAEAAMEDAQVMEVLHTAIRNVTGATDDQLDALDDYISKTQAATGYTEEELRPALVKLTGATKDIGKAQSLLAIAMDVSTARGTSLETVTLALEKAQNGQLTGLQRLGIQTKDASGKTLEFDQILKNLAETYGGATAAAADTFAGKMERMKLVFGEIKESIGAAMLPALEKIATVIIDNMPTFESLANTFGTVVAGALDFVATTILPALQSVFERVWPIIQDAMQAFVTWISGPEGQSLVNTLLDGIGVVLGALQTVFEAVWPIIQQMVQGFIVWLSSPAGQAVIKLLLDGIGLEAQAVQTIFETVWPIVQEAVAVFVGWFNGPEGQKVIADLLSTLKDLMGGLRDLWNAAWPTIKDALVAAKPIILVTLQAITGAVDAIAQAIRIVLELFKRLDERKPSSTSIPGLQGLPGITGKNIPASAEGRYVTRPQLSLVGEDGPELILPLTKPRRMAELLAQAGLRSYGDGGAVGPSVANNQKTITINVSGSSGLDIGRQIATALAGV